MLGPEGAINLIADRLISVLPFKIAEMRDRLDLDTTESAEAVGLQVPLIEMSEPEDTPIELAAFPVVYIVERDTSGVTVEEPGQYADLFRFPYNIALTVYVRDISFTETKAQLRRLGLALREVLFAQYRLDVGDGQFIEFHHAGYSEKYGYPSQQAPGIIAGMVIETMWHADEQLPYTEGPPIVPPHQIRFDVVPPTVSFEVEAQA